MSTKLPPGNGRRKRDTAEECHEKAKVNLLAAANMPAGNERILLERSAAAWNVLGEKLQLDRARLAAGLNLEAEHVRL